MSEFCLGQRARSIIRRRAWAGRFLTLAVLLSIATTLLVLFYETDQVRMDVMRWAWDEGYYAFFQHVAEGSWGGRTWQEWCAIGYTGAAGLGVLWLLFAASAVGSIRAVPGMRRIVQEHEANSWGIAKIIGVIAIIPIVIALFAIFAAAAGAASGSHDDDDDE
jgi:hypothetical protein